MNKISCYNNVIVEIKELINEAKRNVVRSVNITMLITYWNIGRLIVEEEQNGNDRAEYGKTLLKELSKELTKTYGKGFSLSNLKSMRKFFLCYSICDNYTNHSNQKSQTVSGQLRSSDNSKKSRIVFGKLSWSHYIELLQVSDENARKFYEKECINSNWSVRELSRQIDSSLYQRILLSKSEVNKEKVLELVNNGISYNNPLDTLKDPVVLEFIGTKEIKPILESDLEKALIDHLEDFLLELGRGYMFVGSQQRISIGGVNYYVDMVFYNKILKCYLLIDLKIGKLKPENFGQMNMYVNYYKNEINDEDDNSPIGIILCAEKDRVVAEYSMEGLNNNIYASKYTYIIPNKEVLEKELNNLILNMNQNEF